MTEWAAAVDQLLRLRRVPGRDRATRSSSYRSDGHRATFDGRWIGRYAQLVASRGITRPAWMDVVFYVRRVAGEDELSGKGIDGVGEFSIRGRVSFEDESARLTKTYAGAHAVAYHGMLDGRSLRGVWAISPTSYGLFAFHHADDLDRACLPSERSRLQRLWSTFFYTEPPFDPVRHQMLVSEFYRLRPDLVHSGLLDEPDDRSTFVG